MIFGKFVIVILLFLPYAINAQTNFTCSDLHKLYEEAKRMVSVRRLYNGLIQLNNITQHDKGIAYKYFNFEFSQSIPLNVSEEYLKAEIYTQTASLFYDHIKFNDIEAPALFQNFSDCFFEPKAISKEINFFSNQRYRSINGHGNNMKYPKRGESFTSYGRLLKHHYDDHIYSIRKSIRGYELPSPRNIVRKIFLSDKINFNKFQAHSQIPNMLFIFFGQIIKHDTGSNQINQNMSPNAGIRCCSHMNRFQLSPSLTHSSCLPIIISRSDSFYSPKNIRCMDFIRSNIISNNPYKIEVGEQMNRVTSFLDLSLIYGSESERTLRMRSFNGGRLKTNPSNVLPLENGAYFSGEKHASQTKFFIVLQSLFVRNHNTCADKLALINPHWSKEQLFQEARKINIAIYQSIIYNEFLPLLLGRDKSKKMQNIVYNPETDPSTLNEFSNAAFRFFHSFIPSEFELRDRSMKVKKVATSDAINEHESVISYENILRGLIYQNMSTSGYSSEILNKLFKNEHQIGIDLLSIDILRGRDHGIPPYIKYHRFYDAKSWENMKDFTDLTPHISKSAINQLRQTYKTLFDIDLLVGGALEEIDADSGIVGPTFQYIMLEQFYRWKAGDYYFYSHKQSEYSFTKEQLNAIEQFKMSNFLCENSDLEFVQNEAFVNTGIDINCNDMPTIDLSAWKEEIEN